MPPFLQDISSPAISEDGDGQQQAQGGQAEASSTAVPYEMTNGPSREAYALKDGIPGRPRGGQEPLWPTNTLRPITLTPAPASPQWEEIQQPVPTGAIGWQTQRSEASLAPFKQGPSRIRLGFTAAGVCIALGAIMLIFVFIIAQSLPMSQRTSAQAIGQHAKNQVAVTVAPTFSPDPSPTVADVIPTPSTPGAKYIDTIQIGTTMNMNRVGITQMTRDFKVGQRIYITMNVYSIGYQGAVCLDWYVQNTFLTHYAFPTTADPSLPYSKAWSYASSGRRGPGYVNVSWANSVACTDKVLAQRVDFTVGG